MSFQIIVLLCVRTFNHWCLEKSEKESCICQLLKMLSGVEFTGIIFFFFFFVCKQLFNHPLFCTFYIYITTRSNTEITLKSLYDSSIFFLKILNFHHYLYDNYTIIVTR